MSCSQVTARPNRGGAGGRDFDFRAADNHSINAVDSHRTVVAAQASPRHSARISYGGIEGGATVGREGLHRAVVDPQGGQPVGIGVMDGMTDAAHVVELDPGVGSACDPVVRVGSEIVPGAGDANTWVKFNNMCGVCH